MTELEREARRSLIRAYQGGKRPDQKKDFSGNLSIRWEDGFLTTATGMNGESPCEPEELPFVPFAADDGECKWVGPLKPTSEWRFHRDIYLARNKVNAISHEHPEFSTALAMKHEPIRGGHYMIAAVANGPVVPVAPYATYGTKELSKVIVEALGAETTAVLLANHGAVVVAESLERAVWRMAELEKLARDYFHALLIGGPVLLDAMEIERVKAKLKTYGQKPPSASPNELVFA